MVPELETRMDATVARNVGPTFTWRISYRRDFEPSQCLWVHAQSEREARRRFDALLNYIRTRPDRFLSYSEGQLRYAKTVVIERVRRIKQPLAEIRFTYFEKGVLKLVYD